MDDVLVKQVEALTAEAKKATALVKAGRLTKAEAKARFALINVGLDLLRLKMFAKANGLGRGLGAGA